MTRRQKRCCHPMQCLSDRHFPHWVQPFTESFFCERSKVRQRMHCIEQNPQSRQLIMRFITVSATSSAMSKKHISLPFFTYFPFRGSRCFSAIHSGSRMKYDNAPESFRILTAPAYSCSLRLRQCTKPCRSNFSSRDSIFSSLSTRSINPLPKSNSSICW